MCNWIGTVLKLKPMLCHNLKTTSIDEPHQSQQGKSHLHCDNSRSFYTNQNRILLLTKVHWRHTQLHQCLKRWTVWTATKNYHNAAVLPSWTCYGVGCMPMSDMNKPHPLADYCIAGKYGGELNLAVWWIDQPTAKLKSANIKSLTLDCTRALQLCIMHKGN